MNSILGLAVTMAMVFGGYLLAGGELGIILHSLPFEMMMIGGAAIGAFLASNDFSTVKHTGGDLLAAFKGPKWKKSDCQDLLCLMHQLLEKLRESPVEIEPHVEDPNSSEIFAKYPKILKDHEAVEMICDTIRSMIMNFDNVHQVEELLEKHLESLMEERLHGSHALQSMGDALGGVGGGGRGATRAAPLGPCLLCADQRGLFGSGPHGRQRGDLALGNGAIGSGQALETDRMVHIRRGPGPRGAGGRRFGRTGETVSARRDLRREAPRQGLEIRRIQRRRGLRQQDGEGEQDHAVALNSSRPISMRRISWVPAPIS